MKPELHEAMLKTVDLEKLAAQVPPELVNALQTHGLHKVAANLFGIPELTPATAVMYLGRKMASRRAEQKAVSDGLVALESLSK